MTTFTDPLTLTNNGNDGLKDPVKVYVQMAPDDTSKLAPQFATSTEGPWYSGGITWNVPQGNTSGDLVILFVPWGSLIGGYAVPPNLNVQTTTYATLSAKGSTSTTLWVVNAFGTTHDPKIVVTPQN